MITTKVATVCNYGFLPIYQLLDSFLIETLIVLMIVHRVNFVIILEVYSTVISFLWMLIFCNRFKLTFKNKQSETLEEWSGSYIGLIHHCHSTPSAPFLTGTIIPILLNIISFVTVIFLILQLLLSTCSRRF